MFEAQRDASPSRKDSGGSGGISQQGHLRAIHVAGTLRHRKNKRNKRKLTKFERRYTALGPLLKPEQKRIDYVLVHKKKNSEECTDPKKEISLKKKETLRQRFEATLVEDGFSIKSVEIEDLVYKKLHCPFKRLCKEAEVMKLEMPLRGCEKYYERTTWITEMMDKYLETDNEVDYISAPFKMNKIDLFEGYDNPTFFFRPALRSLLTHNILINIDIRARTPAGKDSMKAKILQKQDDIPMHELPVLDMSESVEVQESFCMDIFPCIAQCCYEVVEDKEDRVLSKMGLPYLLMKEVYLDAFVLHEDSELSKINEKQPDKNDGSETARAVLAAEELAKMEDKDNKPVKLTHDPRKEMDYTWGWKSWWKFLPLWKIRNYFGEQISLYFAWSGMLVTSLWIPCFFGLACFIYGLTISLESSKDNVEAPANLTGTDRIKYQMGQIYNDLRGSFDNDVTPFFALVICLWGTVFLELWKRHNSRLAYEWDVDQFEQNEPDRPQFFGTKVKKDPVTQEDNWYYPFKRQMLKFCLSASALIFMICIVFISVAGVIVYRVIISVDYCLNMTPIECLVTTSIVSALLNAISILLLGRFYDWVAFRLTEWENHRTQTQYNDALVIKLFAFQFANSYASCFYIAFFRGRFDAFGVFGLGEEYNDDCEGGNCMSQLSFQVLILMLAKPFPKMFKDLVIPFLKHLWRHRPSCCRRCCCNNQVADEEKVVVTPKDSPEGMKAKLFLEKERLKPQLGDFTLPEYTEKIILYGFLMLFAASFPLAPFIALLWLAIDIRIDAKRLLWLNRRPVAFIAQDIGTWYGILNFVNLVGVISNGFLIAFTSSWGTKYDVNTRLWICLGFEHIVFGLKFLLAYMIPDVPKDVRLAIRREKFQVLKKFEEKVKPLDYSELIPESTADDRVIDDSANYGDFGSDDPETPKEMPQNLTTVTEEEEAVHTEDKPDPIISNVNMWAGIGEIVEVPEASNYDDSMGTASLRKVSVEGSRLLNKTLSDDNMSPKANGGHVSKSPRKPGVTFNTQTKVTKVEDTEDETYKNIYKFEDTKDVDPYSVVNQGDMEHLVDDTQC